MAAEKMKMRALPEGFDEIQTERCIYKPEVAVEAGGKTGPIPLQGWLVTLLHMPAIIGGGPNGEDRAWDAFLVQATAPTKGVDRSGDVIDVRPGEDIIIPANVQLVQVFAQPAKNPDVVFQIYIEPKEKIPLKGGKSMWLFRAAASKLHKKREGAHRLQYSADPPAALSAAQANSAGAEASV